MAKAYKTVFRKIRGRVVPVRVSTNQSPDENQKIEHIRRALKSLRDEPTKMGSAMDRKFQAVFYKIARKQSKETGARISKRISKLKKRGN